MISDDISAINEGLTEYVKQTHENFTVSEFTEEDMEEAKKLQEENGGFIKTMWCGELDCELKMKEEAGMSSRCMPFAQENLGDVCPI